MSGKASFLIMLHIICLNFMIYVEHNEISSVSLQAPPVERYLHDLGQYALGVLHIVTFVPYSRKLIVNATLSNDRVGMAVILDAANSAAFVDPEVWQEMFMIV